jgi:AcrR family transcriptional regulator
VLVFPDCKHGRAILSTVGKERQQSVGERRSDGDRTHKAILNTAAAMASVEGIHGLTIGRLADSLGVSKSGLYAHFGSKEALQLETIETAKAIFEREVILPAYQASEGPPQLESLLAAYFSYLERGVFPGGCFFAGLLAEEDAGDGAIHDVVAGYEVEWIESMSELVSTAQRLGHIAAEADPELVAFELYSCMTMTNFHYVLFKSDEVLSRGRRAMANIIGPLANQ